MIARLLVGSVIELMLLRLQLKQGNIKDLHLCARRVALVGSQKRWLAVVSFVHPALLDLEELELLDGPKIVIMSMLLRISMQ